MTTVTSMMAGAERLACDMRDVLRRRRMLDSPEFLSPRSQSFDVLLYFADRPRNFYQLQQWLGPLEKLAERYSVAIVLTRGDTAALVRRRTLLPIVLLDGAGRDARLRSIQQPKLMLYVNHNNLNYRPLRFAAPVHAFISHGESDKIYMSSNVLKAFDYDFVAGRAARDRLSSILLDYDVDGRTVAIGRPQLDDVAAGPQLPDDDRLVVLYAPTWEGYRPTMRYSSVVSHGEPAVEALIADPGYRVVYRPHPLTGTVLESFRAADQRIRDMINAANERDADAHHIVDDSVFGWHLGSCDVLVADVSAVAYDWLTTAKPQLLTRPVDESASTDNAVLLERLPKLDVHDMPYVVEKIEAVTRDPNVKQSMQDLSDYYYGDIADAASTERFRSAIDRLVEIHDGQTVDDALASPDDETGVCDAAEEWSDKLVEHTVGGRLVAEQESALAATGPAQYVVLFHAADDHSIDQFDRWLPMLEKLDRDRGVVVMAGNTRALKHVQETTTLHGFLAYGSAQPEQLVHTLDARVVIHVEQTELNFREAGIHDVLHVFIGSETAGADGASGGAPGASGASGASGGVSGGSSGADGRRSEAASSDGRRSESSDADSAADAGPGEWRNNRLRVFDRVLVPDESDGKRLAKGLRGFDTASWVRAVGSGGVMDEGRIKEALVAIADDAAVLREQRAERSARIAEQAAVRLDGGPTDDRGAGRDTDRDARAGAGVDSDVATGADAAVG